MPTRRRTARKRDAQGPARRRNGKRVDDPPQRDLAIAVLGAGAPHASLLAGALAYLYRNNKTFDIFFTSGGGALVGLMFVAPHKNLGAADAALREVAEFGVADQIYRQFPVGYKTFFKDSPFTKQIRDFAQGLKLKVEPRPFPGEAPPPGYDPNQQLRRRLYNDVVDFWSSALTPPRLAPTSLGLCSPLPFLEELIDFPAANSYVSPSGVDFNVPLPPIVLPDRTKPARIAPLHLGWFYVNAYNLDTKHMDFFSNTGPADKTSGYVGSLTADAIRAALSFPFIYPPHQMHGNPYCEGALVDPLNLPQATPTIVDDAEGTDVTTDEQIERAKKLPTVRFFLFDILGALEEKLVYVPSTLWDAYGLSILTPVISLAKMSEQIFRTLPNIPELVKVGFRLPSEGRHRPVDWSYSNTTTLWDAGWEAGKQLLRDHANHLPDRVRPPATT